MDTTIEEEGTDLPLAGKRLGLLGKGGTGKSTVSVLLAREFAKRGYEVTLIDADSTNVGLHRAFGIEEAPAPLIDYFGGMVFSGGMVTCPVDDPTPLSGAELSLDQLPGQYVGTTDDGICLLSGGKLGDLGPGAGCDGPISKIARDLHIHRNQNRALTLVDLKAGIEDSARGVITSLDWAIVVVDPSVAAIQVARSVREMVRRIHDGEPPATEHLEDSSLVEIANRIFREAKVRGVLAILNRVPELRTEAHLAGEVSREALVEVIGALKEDHSIGKAWLEGLPIYSTENAARVRGIAHWIEAAEVSALPLGKREFSGRISSESVE